MRKHMYTVAATPTDKLESEMFYFLIIHLLSGRNEFIEAM